VSDMWQEVDLSSAGDVSAVVWNDCGMGFTCACGQPDMIVDSQDGSKTCPKCGRQFRLNASLQIMARDPIDAFVSSGATKFVNEMDRSIMQRADVLETKRVLTCVYSNGVNLAFDVLSRSYEEDAPSDLIVWAIVFEDGSTRRLTMNAQEAIDAIAGLAKCVRLLIENKSPLCSDAEEADK
jgi:hypothetical protein